MGSRYTIGTLVPQPEGCGMKPHRLRRGDLLNSFVEVKSGLV